MKTLVIGAIIFVSLIIGVNVLSPALSLESSSIMVKALDCTAPEGLVCVAPDRERDNICDTVDRFNIPFETAQKLNIFSDTCS